jgi:Tat protein translocase TatB subunit
MCGISGFEFVVILVIALLVLGPDKIPEILRFFGGVMRQVKELSGEVTKLKSDMLSSPQIEELKKQIRAEILTESGGKGAAASKSERSNDIATIDAIKRARTQSEAAGSIAPESTSAPAHLPEPAHSVEPAHPPAHPPEPAHPPAHLPEPAHSVEPAHPPAHPPEPAHPPAHLPAPAHPAAPVQAPDPLAPRAAPQGTFAFSPSGGSDKEGEA